MNIPFLDKPYHTVELQIYIYIYTSKRFQISHVDTAGDWFDIRCEAGTIVVWNPSRNPLLGLAQNSPPLVPEGLENSGKIDSNV